MGVRSCFLQVCPPSATPQKEDNRARNKSDPKVMPGSNYHLSQINIARMVAPLTDPIMADFVAGLAPINALADASPGFVWRFQRTRAMRRASGPTTTTASSSISQSGRISARSVNSFIAARMPAS